MNNYSETYSICYDENVANMCIYGSSFVWDVLNGFEYGQIFRREIAYPMSNRKLEGFRKLAEQRLYYQKNPVKFLIDFFQIQLVDSQAFLFQRA